MKNSVLTLICGLFALTSFAQGTTFTLNGTIKGKSDGQLYLSYTDFSGKPKTDSATIVNGTFTFKGTVKDLSNSYIRPSLKIDNMDDPNFTGFFIEPGQLKLELTAGSFKDYQLTGSKTEGENKQLAALKAPLTEKMKPISTAFSQANDAYIKSVKAKLPEAEQEVLHKKANDIRNQFDPFNAQMDQIDYAFFLKNPDSYLSAYLMNFKISGLPLDSAALFYNNMSKKVQQSLYGKKIASEIDKLKKGSPGATATVFASTGIDGKSLSLADYKGKYVLLDFWASWCVPCREGNPHLKKLYALYKNQGFEIIGISDDDSNAEAWKKAVAQDEIGIWKHVLRGLKRVGNSYDRTNDINENFGIHTLPTKILVDQNGKIIGRYGGGGEGDEAMDKKLISIFGKE